MMIGRNSCFGLAAAFAGSLVAGTTSASAAGHEPVSNTGPLTAAQRAAGANLSTEPFAGTGVSSAVASTSALVVGARSAMPGGRSVIAPDGRVRVTTSTLYPFRAIAQIVRVDNTGTWGCTGWMINANTVMTAGHCVHTGGPNGRWYSNASITVYPGRYINSSNVAVNPYGSCKPRQLFSVLGWTNSSNHEYDYGAIKLNCTVGNSTGWFGYTWTSAEMNNRYAMVTGYPCDKPFGSGWHMGGNTGTTSNPRKTYYTIDTFGCQSGSPVWEDRTTASGGAGPFGIAIHAYGTGLSGSGGQNSGTRITSEVFNNMNAWRAVP
jgi:glutamyl endopeptidase